MQCCFAPLLVLLFFASVCPNLAFQSPSTLGRRLHHPRHQTILLAASSNDDDNETKYSNSELGELTPPANWSKPSKENMKNINEEFRLVWDVFHHQLFYSVMAYAYDYYLSGAQDRKVALGSSFSEILVEAKPALDAKVYDYSKMTIEELSTLSPREQSMYKSLPFMKTIIEFSDYFGVDNSDRLLAYNAFKEGQCLFGVWKDDKSRRIHIFFRGTETGMNTDDLKRDLQFSLKGMTIPPLLKEIMKENAAVNKGSHLVSWDGKPIESIPIHKGFHDYIYCNEKADKQAYDDIMMMLRELDSQPENEGYEIMVGGHSLGGAMASVLALELAGTEFKQFIKPVQCISFSSPLVGCREFRAAYQTMEQEGLLRYLRITNEEDLIIAGWPFSCTFPPKLYKHVGMNLELTQFGYQLNFPKQNNAWERTWRVSIIRKLFIYLRRMAANIDVWTLTHHGMELIATRMMVIFKKECLERKKEEETKEKNKEEAILRKEFNHPTIDALYEDDSLVGGFHFALKIKGGNSF